MQANPNSVSGLRLLAFLGASAVVLGAFGAHALRARLSPELLQSYQTGVLYHFLHTLAFGLALSLQSRDAQAYVWAKRLFVLGIALFSGSIYLLSTRELTGLEALKSALGPITPLGGVSFIAAWVALGLKK